MLISRLRFLQKCTGWLVYRSEMHIFSRAAKKMDFG
jgi:hypothetical protein